MDKQTELHRIQQEFTDLADLFNQTKRSRAYG